jgi:molybdopterin molybdotransferase
VIRKPVIALIATGNELVMPGETPGPDQIISSNNFGLKALLENHGARVRMLPIARDTPESLQQVFAMCAGVDLIVTLGGASVGDHDLVQSVAEDQGLTLDFYRVAMRPGKPLMAGRLNGIPMIGLPGNPVSAMVCGHIFLRPLLRKMLGFPPAPLARHVGYLGVDICENSKRAHYMRARTKLGEKGWIVTAFARQDSALLSVLGNANALLVREVDAPEAKKGDKIEFIFLE